jgi:15-cis-phytoene synthase
MIGPDEQLSLAYAPAKLRLFYAALLGFDAALGQAFRATNEIGLIQIRLAWWRDQLGESNAREPVIAALNDMIRSHDISIEALNRVIDGWSVLLDDPPYDDARLLEYARLRGAGLFAVAAKITRSAINNDAGIGWALTDFARHCSDADTAKRAMALARNALQDNAAAKLPRPLRTFAILTRFAHADCQRSIDEQRAAGSPYRIVQAIGFLLFGR